LFTTIIVFFFLGAPFACASAAFATGFTVSLSGVLAVSSFPIPAVSSFAVSFFLGVSALLPLFASFENALRTSCEASSSIEL